MTGNVRTDRRWMILFLAAALILASSRGHFSRPSPGLKPVANRKLMADLTLPQLGGGEWKLADHRGQVVLINYWATWCEPCRDELPGLSRIVRDSAPQGLAVVGVSFDYGSGQARTQAVQTFVNLYHLPYPIAFPDARLDLATRDIGLPTTVLIDRHGRTARIYVGPFDRANLTTDITALLGES